MLDQSFSVENFLTIFYRENRKGSFIRGNFSDEYLAVHDSIKKVLEKKKKLPKGDGQHEVLQIQLDVLNLSKKKALESHLTRVSQDINCKEFQLKLNAHNQDGKWIYTIPSEAEPFFAIKQLQSNVARTFKVKQANRYDIVMQLKVLLQDGFPKHIVRTDIKNFFESIPQSVLIARVDENQLLTFQSRKFIKSLLATYERIKAGGQAGCGIPRGIGISAYLAELYFREIDNEIKELPGLIYYARYVDDMVILFEPNYLESRPNFLDAIKMIVEKHQLKINEKNQTDGKTFEYDLKKIGAKNFDFLGYKFIIDNGKLVNLSLSSRKLKKYEERLASAVEAYNLQSKYNERIAQIELINRIKFLTGNFYLVNNKKTIKAGIYYSNIALSSEYSTSDFVLLNQKLANSLDLLNPYSALNIDTDKVKSKILKRCDFLLGFTEREKHFHSFTYSELIRIKSIW